MKKQVTDTFHSKHFAVEIVSARLQLYDKNNNLVLKLDKEFKPFVFTPTDKMKLDWNIVGDQYETPTLWRRFKAWVKK